ncbi:hypothetical protein ACFWG6_34660 [Streptomyces erythrochromogenes]|uniref:hypothetical protein n=1 Tax=Streptomyces erythrochromogenes TaxID=285574 RepID=UPI00362E9D58
MYGDPDIEGVPPALEPLISACLAKDPAERPGLDQIISICSSPECGTWTLSQKGPTAIGGSFGCLTGILCLAATVAATVAGAKSPVPAVGIFVGLFLGWIVPWRLMNLKLTPAEALELRTMLTHHHLPRPPERSGRGR